MTTNAAHDYALSLQVPRGVTKRTTCPECGKANTFTVTNDGITTLYNCYSANCSVHGGSNTGLATDSFGPNLEKRDETFVMPEGLVPVARSTAAMEYLREFGCMDALLTGRADIMYDVAQQRVVFMVHHNGEIVDATGRALDKRVPKWYRYGKSSRAFECVGVRNPSVAVVVEDCASACSASRLFTGVALLGTNILPSHIQQLRKYTDVIVALDKDASVKAIDLAAQIGLHVPTSVKVLEADLKYLDKDELEELFL